MYWRFWRGDIFPHTVASPLDARPDCGYITIFSLAGGATVLAAEGAKYSFDPAGLCHGASVYSGNRAGHYDPIANNGSGKWAYNSCRLAYCLDYV